MIYFLGVILAILFASIGYFSTESLVLTISVFTITLLFFVIIVSRRFALYKKKIERFKECNLFMNNFVISLSIKNSINGAYETTYGSMNDDFKHEIKNASNLKEIEKILYLKKYFKFHIYSLFTDVLLMWQEEGGNIIDMTSFILEQARSIEDYIVFSDSKNKKMAIEFSVLWVFSLAILVILKIALKDFYSYILSQTFFKFAIGAIFLIVLVSIEVITRKMCKLEIRGYSNEK